MDARTPSTELLDALPKHVHLVRSGNRRYFYFQLNRGQASEGPRIRLRNWRSKDELEQARRKSAEANAVDRSQLFRAFVNAKRRAQEGQYRFSLDMPYLEDLLRQQQGRCAISGIEFSTDGYAGCQIKPFSVSLDRIEGKLGYAKGNVRLVCCLANFAMGQWGIAAVEQFATALVGRIAEQERNVIL